ncbi:MAG: hypothetical protein Q4C49_06865 [Bacillota bacterium]|nr:hypothetical protein [Bacillota bacterium]
MKKLAYFTLTIFVLLQFVLVGIEIYHSIAGWSQETMYLSTMQSWISYALNLIIFLIGIYMYKRETRGFILFFSIDILVLFVIHFVFHLPFNIFSGLENLWIFIVVLIWKWIKK